MGRKCATCEHPDRATIELGVANRVPLRLLSKRHGITMDGISRHKNNHMPPQLIAALMLRGRASATDLEHLKITESEGILQHLVALRGRFYRLLDQAEDLGDFSSAARAGQQLLKNVELTAKLLGELQTGGTSITQNVLVMPEYHGLRVALLSALKPFPEARLAVVRALESFETPVIEGEAQRVLTRA